MYTTHIVRYNLYPIRIHNVPLYIFEEKCIHYIHLLILYIQILNYHSYLFDLSNPGNFNISMNSGINFDSNKKKVLIAFSIFANIYIFCLFIFNLFINAALGFA